MIRSFNPAPFNAMANHPSVRKWIGGQGHADLTHIIADERNFCFLTDKKDATVSYVDSGGGLYAIHMMGFPSVNGWRLMCLFRDSLHFMFALVEASEIMAVVPDGSIHADKWAQFIGTEERHRIENVADLNGEMVGVSVRFLSRNKWLRLQNNAALAQTGSDKVH